MNNYRVYFRERQQYQEIRNAYMLLENRGDEAVAVFYLTKAYRDEDILDVVVLRNTDRIQRLEK